jgi:hypothetical protein
MMPQEESAHPVNLMQLAGSNYVGEDLCRQFRLTGPAGWETIRTTEGTVSRYLMASALQDVATAEMYNPLETHGLVFQFAALEEQESCFLAFARQFGFLGVRTVNESGSTPRVGELWDDWLTAQRDIASAVAIWERRTEWDLPSPRSVDGVYQIGTGAAALAAEINQHLCGATTMRVVWSHRRETHEIRVLPTTLLGVMWWQLARLLAGETSYSKCEVCGRYIERGPRDGGTSPRMSNVMYCSAACRQRAHRSRIRHAKEMSASGTSVEAIAAYFTTDVPTVHRWLAGKSTTE